MLAHIPSSLLLEACIGSLRATVTPQPISARFVPTVVRTPAVIVLLIINTLLFAAVAERIVYDGAALPGVSAPTIALGGKSERDIRRAIETFANRLEQRSFSSSVGDVHLTMNAGEVGLAIDVDAAVRAARGSGKSGNPIDAIMGVVLRRIRNNEIPLKVAIDEHALDGVAQRWVHAANAHVRNADVTFSDNKIVVVASHAANGIRSSDVIDRLRRALTDPTSAAAIDLNTTTVQPTINTNEADAIARQARSLLNGPYRITTSPATYTIEPSKISQLLRTNIVGGRLELTINIDALRALVAGRLDSPTVPPVDATFRITPTGGVEVVASRDGRGPDLQHIAQEILAGHHNIEAPLTLAHPAHDSAWAHALGIHELVATFTTHHPCCQARVTNIHAAAKLLDGAVVEPGATFSLNDRVGARTAARGFVVAPVFYGEFSEDVGGGVSQVATTTFNAAFWGGFRIVAHKPHTIFIDRYPLGREATVNYPSLDLKWQNNTSHGVFIHTAFTGTSLTVSLYGDREHTTVRETVPGCSVGPVVDTSDDPRCMHVLENVPVTESDLTCPVTNPSDDLTNKCATLLPGVRADGAKGHAGYAVEFFRTITKPGHEPTVERFFWRYRMLPDIVLIGAALPPGVTTTTGVATPGVPTTSTTNVPGVIGH